MITPIPQKRELAEQLRYQYVRYRQIDRAINALERLQRMREKGSQDGKPARKRAGKAA
jgi:hypothetical protein